MRKAVDLVGIRFESVARREMSESALTSLHIVYVDCSVEVVDGRKILSFFLSERTRDKTCCW